MQAYIIGVVAGSLLLGGLVTIGVLFGLGAFRDPDAYNIGISVLMLLVGGLITVGISWWLGAFAGQIIP